MNHAHVRVYMCIRQTGIAQVAAQRGLTVLLNDMSASAIDRGLAGLQKSLERLVRKGSMTPDNAAATLGRIHTSHGSLEVRLTIEVVERVGLLIYLSIVVAVCWRLLQNGSAAPI